MRLFLAALIALCFANALYAQDVTPVAFVMPRGGKTTGGGGGVTLTGITLDSVASTASFNANASNSGVGATQNGVIAVTTTGGSFTGSVALGTGSGCPGTDNGSFQVSGSNLLTNGAPQSSDIGSTYAVCLVATQSGATGSPLAIPFTVTGVQKPGVSAALYNNPYYTCSTNRYVSTTGSDANDGTTPTTGGGHGPWLTIAHADSSMAAGVCLNVESGTYALANENLAHGGNTASSTGYAVYRCATFNGCTITDSSKPFCAGLNCGGVYPDYIIFDNFIFNPTTPNTANGQAMSCYNGDTGTTASGCHHWFAINNTISYYGQSGLQFNDSEYYYGIHNKITQSSHDCQAAQGSGISFGFLKVVSGYSPTADDTNNPKMSLFGPSFPYYDAILWNDISNSYIGCTGGNTDGNGIIRDENGNTVAYTHPSLVAFNLVYNNGGNGVHIFSGPGANVTIANNSSYNNALDPYDTGTDRAMYDDNGSSGTTFINNIAYAIPGSSPLNYNFSFGLTASNDVATNNVSYCATAPAGGGCNQTYNGATFSCSSNKCSTAPNWVNVGNTSQGTESTLPNGINFALQSSSAAIGYGATETYLSSQSVDAGPCSHLLAVCP